MVLHSRMQMPEAQLGFQQIHLDRLTFRWQPDLPLNLEGLLPEFCVTVANDQMPITDMVGNQLDILAKSTQPAAELMGEMISCKMFGRVGRPCRAKAKRY
jgi:hypothetical protein